MKKRQNNITGIIAIVFVVCVIVAILVTSLSGCAMLGSKLKDLKGNLIGNSYTGTFYDNYGVQYLKVSGDKIALEGVKIKEYGIDSKGKQTVNYSLSSVVKITIDGEQMTNCGSTAIFAEKGLNPDTNFMLRDIKSDSGLMGLTSISKTVNSFKNAFGKATVAVIQSQMGVPITAYSGSSVYWEVPSDLPKMTCLLVDGKRLYIHRANFNIIDKNLIN